MPQLLTLALLLAGVLVVGAVPAFGKPTPPPPIFGQPGVILTIDRRLQQIERDIAANNAHTFTLRLIQAEIDAEIAAQMARLGPDSLVRAASLQTHDGTVLAAGVLDLGILVTDVAFELIVSPADCTPHVSIVRFDAGDDTTPQWIEDRAREFINAQIQTGLERGLGFCVEEAVFQAGEVLLIGTIQGEEE